MNLANLLTLPMYAQLPILVLIISMVYSATRYDEWRSIFVEAYRWGSRMVVFLVAIGAALWLLSYVMANPATAP